MSALCQKVDAFADGELAPEDLSGFENHLADCTRCGDALELIFAMRGIAETTVDRRANVTAQIRVPRKRWAWLSVDAFGVVAAAGAALMLFWPRPEAWVSGPGRPIEPRLDDPRADVFRPYDQLRGGAPADAVSYHALGKLQRDKDVKGLVSRLLLQRQVSEAARFLRDAGELDNERAVAALLEGRSEEALGPIERTLGHTSPGKPGWAQAQWNRALALRELALPRTAAAAFRAVEALAEPGWSGEAGVWARKLEGQARDGQLRYGEARQEIDRLARTHEPPEQSVVEGWPDLVRAAFYQALPAPRLAPLAAALDAHYGGQHLSDALAGKDPGKDPWREVEALAAEARGESDHAVRERLLRHAIDLAAAFPLQRLALERQLARLELERRPLEAEPLVRRMRTAAQALRSPPAEAGTVVLLAHLALAREDLPTARAYAEELVLAAATCSAPEARAAAQALARGDAAQARRALLALESCPGELE